MDDPTDAFDFYLKFAKPLVLNLRDPNDRVIAAAWVQKLKDSGVAPESVRKDYLKLLLFVLHRKRLVGPFAQNPTGFRELKSFPADFQVLDVAKELILADQTERKRRLKSGLASGDYPPYSIECSADLLEYAAAQDIPKFGVHAYYAISLEPIPKWDNMKTGVLPKAAVEVLEKSIRQVSSAPDLEKAKHGESMVKKSPSKGASVLPKLSPKMSPKLSPKSPKSAEELPSPKPIQAESPFGLLPPVDDRPKITWGSNLIDVTEPPEHDLDDSFGIMGDELGDFLVDEDTSAFTNLPASSPLPPRTPPPSPTGSPALSPTERPAAIAQMPRKELSFNLSIGSPIKSSPVKMLDDLLYDEEHPQAASLPYLTPPRHDLPAASLPYRTPPMPGPSPAPSLPYRRTPGTPPTPYPSPAPSLPYQTPPMPGASPAPSLPYRRTPGTPPTPYPSPAPSLPYQTPPMPGASPAPSIPYRRTPGTPPTPYPSPAPSLPYQTPPMPGASPAPSIPYRRTPGTPPTPYPSPAPSLPYQTPPMPGPSPAPSLPYRRTPGTPPSPEAVDVEIEPVSDDAREIIDEANESMAQADEANVSVGHYDAMFTGRRMDMPRTPPMFSRFDKIRQGPGAEAHYEPQEFGLTGDEQLQPAVGFEFQRAATTSPGKPQRMQYRPHQHPVEQVFPELETGDQWSQMFFEAQGGDLIVDEDEETEMADGMEVVGTPEMDVDERIKDLMLGLADRKEASPVAGGVAATTPRSSPSPVRTKLYGTDFPLFTEMLPLIESPEVSPTTRVLEAAEEQYANLYDGSPRQQQLRAASPRAPTPPQRSPSPVRDPNTDAYGLPIVLTAEILSPPKAKTPSPKPKTPLKPKTPAHKSPVAGPSTAKSPSPKKVITPAPKTEEEVKELAEEQYNALMESPKPEKPAELSHEEVEEIAVQQYAQLYESLIAEPEPDANVSGSRSPRSPRSPTRPAPDDLMGVEAPVFYQSPPQPPIYDTEMPVALQSPIQPNPVIRGWQSPTRDPRLASPTLPPMIADFNSIPLGREAFPEEFVGPSSPQLSPPTPPRALTYEEMADPFECQPDFYEPQVELMDDEMAGLGEMLSAHDYQPYRENFAQRVITGRKTMTIGKRRQQFQRQHAIDEEPELMLLPSPVKASPVRQIEYRSPERPQPGPSSEASILSEAEEYFVDAFENPQQQEMMRRVMGLVADVEDEALFTAEDVEIMRAAHPLRAIEAEEGQQDLMMASPPREQQELLTIEQMEGPVSPLRPPSPIPEFNLQGPAEEFMPGPTQYQLPYALPESRHVFEAPLALMPADEEPPPFEDILGTEQAAEVAAGSPLRVRSPVLKSPSPIRRNIPTPGTYVSPPGSLGEFFMENLNRPEAPYRQGPTLVFTEGKMRPIHRQASHRVPRMRKIRELPGFDEEAVYFHEHVDRAPHWFGEQNTQAGLLPIQMTKDRQKMQQRRAARNVLSSTNLPRITETQETYEPLVSPQQQRKGRPRMTKRTVRRQINFDQPPAAGMSPEPPKVVSPLREPLPMISDRPLPPARMATPPRAATPPQAPGSVRRVLFGSPLQERPDRPPPRRITLYGSPVAPELEASPTTAKYMLAMQRHAGLLAEGTPPPPEDLMGGHGRVSPGADRGQHLLDMGVPQDIQSPMRPPVELPGWETPPHLRPGAQGQTHLPAVADFRESALAFEQPPMLDDDIMGGSPSQLPALATEQAFFPSPPRQHAPFPMKKITTTKTVKSPEMTQTTSTTVTEPARQPTPSPPRPQTPLAETSPYQMHPPMTPRTPAHASPRPSPYWSGGTPMATPPFRRLRRLQNFNMPSPPKSITPSPMALPGLGGMEMQGMELDFNEDPQQILQSSPTGMDYYPAQEPAEEPEEWADWQAVPADALQVQGRYSQLASAEEFQFPQAQTRALVQAGPLVERVEQLVADVPLPYATPPLQVSPTLPQHSPFQSPAWSPSIPTNVVPSLDAPFSPSMSPRSPMGSPRLQTPPSRSPSPGAPPRSASPVFAMSPQTLGVVPFLGEEGYPEEVLQSPQASPMQALPENIQFSPPAYQSPPRQPTPRMPTPPRAPTPTRAPTPSPPRAPSPRSPPMQMTVPSPRRSPVVGNLVAVSPQRPMTPTQQAGNVMAAAGSQYAELMASPYTVETTETVEEEFIPEHIMDRGMPTAAIMQMPSAMTDRQLDWASPPRLALPQLPESPYRPELHIAQQQMLPAGADEFIDQEYDDNFLLSPTGSPMATTPRGSPLAEAMQMQVPGAPHVAIPSPRQSPTTRLFDQAVGGPGIYDVDMPEMYASPELPASPPEMYGSPPTPPATYGSPPSPYDEDFQRSIAEHHFTPDFFDPQRRKQLSKRVQVGSKRIAVRRELQPPGLATIADQTEPPFIQPKFYVPPPRPAIPTTPYSPTLEGAYGPSPRASPFAGSPYAMSPQAMSPHTPPQPYSSPMAGPSNAMTPGASETTINEEIVYSSGGQPKSITKEKKTVSPTGEVEEEYECTEMFGGDYESEIMDTSDIPEEDYGADERDDGFGWMD